MSGLWKILVVLGVVFAVGCGATAAQDSPSPMAPILAGEAVGPTLTADDRFNAMLEQQEQQLTADERLDAAVQAAGRELSADDRLDAAVRAVQAAGHEQIRAAAIQAAADDRLEVWSQWGVLVGPTLVVAVGFVLSRWIRRHFTARSFRIKSRAVS